MALNNDDKLVVKFGCAAFTAVLCFYLVLIAAVVAGIIYLVHHIH